MKDLEVIVLNLIAIRSRQSLINPSIANHAQKYLTKLTMNDVSSDGLHFLVWGHLSSSGQHSSFR